MGKFLSTVECQLISQVGKSSIPSPEEIFWEEYSIASVDSLSQMFPINMKILFMLFMGTWIQSWATIQTNPYWTTISKTA